MVAEGSRQAGFLMDSNVVVAAFAEERGVLQKLERTPTEQIFVPAVALGEFYFGALKSQRQEANLRRVEEFTAASKIVPVDASVARRYGEVRDEAERLPDHGRNAREAWKACERSAFWAPSRLFGGGQR